MRSRPRVLGTDVAGAVFFPPDLLPVLGHPLVDGLGSEATSRLLAQRLCQYLHFTTELESVAVTPVTIAIARGRSGLALPSEMAADAYTITTDEAAGSVHMVAYDVARHRRMGTLGTLHTLPRPVIVLLFGIAINRMGSFIAIFLILYLTQLGFSPADAGFVLTVFGIGSILGVYLGGRAADQFGPRRVIVTSMFFSGLAVGALAVEKRYLPLLAITFVAGVVTQCYRPAAAAMLAELTPPHRLVIATAATRLGVNIGATIGPLLGAWLAVYSYPAVFLVDALTAIAFGLVALFVLPETHGAHQRKEVAAAQSAGPEPAAAASGETSILRDRRYLCVLVGMLATALAEVQYQVILPLHLVSQGAPTPLYGTIVAVNGALVILLELPLTRFVQRLPLRAAIAFGDLLIGLGLAFLGLAGPAWIFFAGAAIWTMGEIVSGPSINAYPALAAPRALRGRYIGALNACQTTGYAVGPIIGTTLFQYTGRAAWLMCAVLGVVAFAGMWLGVRNSAAAGVR